MPVNFLSESERSRLSHFPEDISDSDLNHYFILSHADLQQSNAHRKPENRLGFAIQLCALRYMGFCPEMLQQTPGKILEFVAKQLDVESICFQRYGTRAQTRTEHLKQVQVYLGYRDTQPKDLRALLKWLVQQALEHDKPSRLFQLAADKLRHEKRIRPGVTVVERLVSQARHQATKVTYRQLKPLLKRSNRRFLDDLLEQCDEMNAIRLNALKKPAVRHSPKAILKIIHKITFLRSHGVADWDLSAINPNRLKFLARVAKKTSIRSLKRAPVERRYPLLIAYAHQALIEGTDEAADLFIQCLAEVQSRAHNDLKAFRLREAVALNEKVLLFQTMGQVLLDPEVKDPQVRSDIFAQVSREELEAALHDCDRLARPVQDESIDYIASRYSYLRQFIPTFLETFSFQSNRENEPLLKALETLQQLNQTRTRKVPEDATVDFIKGAWRHFLYNDQGQLQRRYYELAVLWNLRSALRSGNLWIEGARRYANPVSYLMPTEKWQQVRSDFCQTTGLPESGQERLEQLNQELQLEMDKLIQNLKSDHLIRLDDEQIVVTPDAAEEDSVSLKQLRRLVNRCLPRIDLTDLLVEVDHFTRFSDRLIHTQDQNNRSSQTPLYLYASILSQACNLGPVSMARAADLSVEQLQWHSHWYLDDNTLPSANIALVNYHHHLPLAQYWGGGTLSSSDGQRFPVTVKNNQAVALPKYFGYGKGVTFYTWLSDQFSQYGSKVIPSTHRDATYVLDGLQDNETELDILEHTTDTAGYSEVIFALFDLCGYRFSPRIRDLSSQQLYWLKKKPKAKIKCLFKGRARQKLITDNWDEMLRSAGSLNHGWVTSSLLMSKLGSFSEPNRLFQALQEYGRVVKTLYILRYWNSLDYRKRVKRQLNKGESVHSLRRFIVIARQAELRQRYQDGLENQANCLTLLSNAIMLWNTVYMQAALDYIKEQGYDVKEEDIPHLAPTRCEHINPHGKMLFNIAQTKNRKGLRPLRKLKKKAS